MAATKALEMCHHYSPLSLSKGWPLKVATLAFIAWTLVISAVCKRPLSHDVVICDVSKEEIVFTHPIVTVRLDSL